MEKIMESKGMKIVIIAIILMTMLCTYLPVITKADNAADDEYVKLSELYYTKGDNVISNRQIDMTYRLQFTGVQTGFQDVVVIIKNADDGKPIAKTMAYGEENPLSAGQTNPGSYSTIIFTPIRTGTDITGHIKVNFDRGINYENYEKKLMVEVSGQYRNPITGNTEKIAISKVITANVTSAPDTSYFSAYANTEFDLKKNSSSTYITRDYVKTYNNFEIDKITQTYNVDLRTTNETFSKTVVRINRTSPINSINPSDINSEENLTIGTAAFTANGYATNIIRNVDGTTDVEITRGTQMTEYDSTGFNQIKEILPIQITYKMIENSGATRNEGVGSSTISVGITNHEEGFNVKTDATGTEYTFGKYDYKFGYEHGYNIWSNVQGTSGYDYDLEYDAPGKMDTLMWDEIENGSITTTDNTNVLLDVRGQDNIDSANEQANKLVVTNYNSGNTNVQEGKVTSLVYDDSGTSKTLNISKMTVNKITVNLDGAYVNDVKFYKKGDVVGTDEPFFTATSENNEYIVPEGQEIKEYYAVLGDILKETGEYSGGFMVNGYSSVASWNTEWNIKTEDLKESLTDEQIKGIKSISRYQGGKYTLETTELSPVTKEVATTYIKCAEDLRWSSMELNVKSYDATVVNVKERKTITLSMYNNVAYMKDVTVKDVNPKFFVKLDNIFDYSNFSIDMTQNPYMYMKEVRIVQKEDAKYLQIDCNGTYDSTICPRLDITIKFDRILRDNSVSLNQYVTAYMLTDNENYVISEYNTNNFSKGEITPSRIYSTKAKYQVVQNTSLIQGFTGIQNGRYIMKSNMSDNYDTIIEKNCPMVVQAGKYIKYVSQLTTTQPVNNINIVCRLPQANNIEIKSDTRLLDNFVLPDEYMDKYGSNLNAITKGSVTPEISLVNLKNVKVYELRGIAIRNEIDPQYYTIGYSTDGTAGFDSTYTPYIEGLPDLVNAKTLQVKVSEDYILKSGYTYEVQYEMEMPEQVGMVGAVTGSRYTKVGEETPTVLDSEAAYVINGNESGNIEVQKTFEDCEVGIAPTGKSLANIQFKLKDLSGNYVQVEGTDLVAVTDATGKAMFTNIQPGEYEVEEITDIEGYEKNKHINFITLERAETKTVQVQNDKLRGTLNIEKKWEDTNEQQGPVTFILKRTTNDKINYSVSVTTDEQGKATITNIPYGEYELKETSGVAGWSKEIENVIIDQAEKTTEVTNHIGKAKLVINKTVPEGETVEGLKFDISSMGMMTYENTEGTQVINDTQRTITIGEDYSADPNVNVQIAADKLSATITLNNSLLGLYTIEEVEMPKVPGKDIEKFIAVKESISLEEDGKEYSKDIKNSKKTGYLAIQKAAYLQQGEDQLDIGDLSGFKVKVTGTSSYGTVVDKEVSLNQDGYAKIALEIGDYTVTEVPVDGYDIYYKVNGNLLNSQTGTQVTVEYSETEKRPNTTMQEITNVHTGVGYVKVIKSLEGITDPQKVKDAGIKFKVVGKNIAGGNVEEEIEINQIDLESEVAYGISGPISVGGDYELQEEESTVPEYFEGMEPQKVELTTASTQIAPLVINVENKRGKGKLDAVTQTLPEDGPLTGIKYKVTEVKIKDDGTYERVGEPVEIEGSNGSANTSFAEITEIAAGNYLVEQTQVPAGWKKDVNQIVEVPSYSTGHAAFEITKEQEIIGTQVEISKQILNEDDEIATAEEMEAVKLNPEESYEIKLTNVDTKQEYYTFISGAQKGIICGLPVGTYEIEELYKPKYVTEGYYKIEDGIAAIKMEKNAQEKYEITIANETSKVSLLIKNKINTKFPFGGQDKEDNYSKYNVEAEQMAAPTKTIIYVVDEDSNLFVGAKFKLLDKNGQEVSLGTVGTEITTTDKKIIIKGLEIGNYTLVNTSVPVGYLQPEDKQVEVFDKATRIARVEIQKNIPRGSLSLSTTYQTLEGETKYIPRSKYKVVNPTTGEELKFAKTATGDYVKSELADAVDEISIKSGVVNVTGIEVGTYEVGLTGVSAGYGMKKEVPEQIAITEGTKQNVNVQVAKNKIKQIETGWNNTMYLDENGDLYIIGRNYSGSYGSSKYATGYPDVANNTPFKIEFPEEVKIDKFTVGYQHVVALDTTGKVWTWGYQTTDDNGIREHSGCGPEISKKDLTKPLCMSDLEGSPLKQAYNDGIKITEIKAQYDSTMAIDSEGKLWAWGDVYSICDYSTYPVCLSTKEGNSIFNAYELGIKMKKIFSTSNTPSQYLCVDSIGRIYYFDNSMNDEIQYLLDEYTNMNIVSSAIRYVVDQDGNLWDTGKIDYWTSFHAPLKIDKSKFENAKIVKVVSNGTCTYVVTDAGEIYYTNGYSEWECKTTNIEAKMVDIALSYFAEHVIALDSDGKMYGMGRSSNYGELGYIGSDQTYEFRRINIEYAQTLDYNVKFDSISNYSAIDNKGKVWTLSTQMLGDGGSPKTDIRRLNTIADEKIVKEVGEGSGNSTILISESGKIYIFGYSSNLYIYGKYISDNCYIPVDITDLFELEDGVKIKEASLNYNCAIVVDSLGRVWTWGSNNYGELGTGDTSSQNQKPVCISDNIEEALHNVKIVDVAQGYETAFALDDQGRVWAWGYMNYSGLKDMECTANSIPNNQLKPICLSELVGTKYNEIYQNGVKFTKLAVNTGSSSPCIGLDADGQVWNLQGQYFDYYSGAGGNLIEKMSEIKGNILYDNYRNDNNYKIVNIKILDTKMYFKDNKGDSYVYDTNIRTITKLDVKDIIDASSYGYIDSYGQIFKWDSTESVFTAPVSNPLYNKKIKKIYQEGIVEVDNNKGEIYRITQDNIKFNSYSEKYITDYLGINIVDSYKFISSNGEEKSMYVALDENGKVWTWGGNKNGQLGNNIGFGNTMVPACVSDIEGLELNQAYKNDSGFKIVKMLVRPNESLGGTIILLDNNGKVWACGSESPTNNNSSISKNEFICISDIPLTALNQKYIDNSDFKITNIDFTAGYTLTDSDGNTWVWGTNTYGMLGNGTTAEIKTPYCLSQAMGVKIQKIKNSQNVTLILDENGNIWSTGGVYSTSYNNGVQGWSGSYRTTPTKIVTTMTGIKDFYIDSYKVIAWNDTEVWTWGNNKLGALGTGTATGIIYSPIKMESYIPISKGVYENGSENANTTVIDVNGKVWSWGYKFEKNSGVISISYSKPVCASDDENCIINGVKIVDSIYEYNSRRKILIDENGNKYYFINNKSQPNEDIKYIDIFKEEFSEYYGDLGGKTVKQSTKYMAIDIDGNLYGWSGYDGITNEYPIEPICITSRKNIKDAIINSNKLLINKPIENDLNGLKFEKLENDQIAVDENQNYWFFPENGKVVDLTAQLTKNRNPLYGKTIIDILDNGEYVITSENEIYKLSGQIPEYIMKDISGTEIQQIERKLSSVYPCIVALDTAGKVWTIGSGKYGQLGNGSTDNITEQVCISDIEGTDFNNRYKNDPNFKIVKIITGLGANNIAALDNYGKVWTWGYNANGELGNGTTMYSKVPICISDIEGTEFKNAYSDSNFKIESIQVSAKRYVALDNNGKVWVWGLNTLNNLGAGNIEIIKSPLCISDLSDCEISQKDSTFKINKIYIDYSNMYCIGNDGKVYTCGQCYYGKTGFTVDKVYLSCVSEDITGITDLEITSYNKVAAYGENTVWIWGQNILPTQVSTSITVDQIVFLQSFIIKDTNGKIWQLKDKVITCLSDNASSIIFGKQIVNMDYSSSYYIVLLEDIDGGLYELDNIYSYEVPTISVFNKYDNATQIIFGDKTIEHIKQVFKSFSQNRNGYTLGQCNGKIWDYTYQSNYNKGVNEILQTIENLIPQNKYTIANIKEVLDNTHIKTVDEKVYSISESGDLTYINSYIPETETETNTGKITIEGVNLVEQTKYKAIDDQGNLYVHEKYIGGYKITYDIICATQGEYVIEPIYSSGNGWTVVKQVY